MIKLVLNSITIISQFWSVWSIAITIPPKIVIDYGYDYPMSGYVIIKDQKCTRTPKLFQIQFYSDIEIV